MTITILPSRNEYTATTAQTVFNYTFKIFAATDLNVFVTPDGQTADDSTDQTTAFSVTGAGSEDGGTITLVTPSTVGDLVTIVSDIPESRTTDYQFNGDFLPDTVNDDFDRVVSLVKQIDEKSNRSLISQESQQGSKPLTLPEPSSLDFLRWRSDLSGLENVDVAANGAPTDADLVTYNQGDTEAVDRTVEEKLQESVSIEDFGASPSLSDNTAAINAAFDYLRAQINTPVSGVVDNIPVNLVFPPGVYTCLGSINATGIRGQGWKVDLQGATILSKATGKTAFDLLHSRFGVINNLTLYGDDTSEPAIGVQIGRNDTLVVAGSIQFNNPEIVGHFSRTCLYNFGSEVDSYFNPTFINYNTSSTSYALIIEGRNEFGALSDYQTVAVGTQLVSNIQHTFIHGSIRKLISGPAMWFSRLAQLKFVNVYGVSIDDNIIEFHDDGLGFSDIDLDIHFETTGLTAAVHWDIIPASGVTTINMRGFTFRDHTPFGEDQLFTVAGATRVDIFGDINISGYQGGALTNGMFVPVGQFTIQGDMNLPNAQETRGVEHMGRLKFPLVQATDNIGGYPEVVDRFSDKRYFKGATRIVGTTVTNLTGAQLESANGVDFLDGVMTPTALSSAPSPLVDSMVAVDDGTNWSLVNATGNSRPVFYDGTAGAWIAMF